MKDVARIERLFIGISALVIAAFLIGSHHVIMGCLLATIAIAIGGKDVIFAINWSTRQKMELEIRKREMSQAIEKLKRNPGATCAQIARIRSLPAVSGYQLFLQESNGGTGTIQDNAKVELWPCEKLSAENVDWKTRNVTEIRKTYGLFFFGSNNSGTKYAFHIKNFKPVVVSVATDGHVVEVANTFVEFVTRLDLK